jgi:hypothetical protein
MYIEYNYIPLPSRTCGPYFTLSFHILTHPPPPNFYFQTPLKSEAYKYNYYVIVDLWISG